jgi:alcohol dehydrogenase class IV
MRFEFAREDIQRAARSLRRAVRAPDAAAREDMAFASLLSGLALAQAACEDFAIPRLSACGLTSDMLPAVVAEAQRASSTKGNPIALTDEELAAALGEAL